MAKEKLHFRFNVGDKAVCIERGSGYGAPVAYDTVGLSIRAITDNGRLGPREAVTHYAHRAEIASIGLAFLDVASRMTPETIWARSETVGASQCQPRRIVSLSEDDKIGLNKFLDEQGENAFKSPVASFTKLKNRMPTLHRMQYLLEHIDDELATKLDLLLIMVEHAGDLPFGISMGVVAEGELKEAAEAMMAERDGAVKTKH